MERVRANGKCKQPNRRVEKRRRRERRARFRLRFDIIYLGSQSAPASLVIFSLVRLCAEREDKDHPRPSFRAVRCVTRKEKNPRVCVFSAPVLQSRSAWESPAFAVYKRAFLPCVWLIGENNLSIGPALLAKSSARRYYIRGRGIKVPDSRFSKEVQQTGVYVCVRAYALHLYTYVYTFCRRLSQRADSMSRPVSERKCLSAMSEPNGIKSTREAA